MALSLTRALAAVLLDGQAVRMDWFRTWGAEVEGALSAVDDDQGVAAAVRTDFDALVATGQIAEITEAQALDAASDDARLASGRRIAAALDARRGFFVSPYSLITPSGSLSFDHGLAVVPHLVQPFLLCISAEFDFIQGDVVPINPSERQSLTMNETSIFLRYGAGTYQVIRKDTGGLTNITTSKWRFFVRAWVFH